MAILDMFVKYFWVLMIAFAGMNGYDRFELKQEELNSQQNLNNLLPPKFKAIERELEEVKRFESNLDESKKRVEEVIKRISVVQKQLPAEINDTEVNNTLSNIAQNLKMQNPNPLPKDQQVKDFYISKDFNFDVQGTFLQGLIFFEKLDNLAKEGRILNVKYVRFSESQEGDPRSRFKILNLNTIVEAFKYNPSYDPDQG